MKANALVKKGLALLDKVGPIDLPANIKLTYRVYSGTATKNPETGNYEKESTTVELLASGFIDPGNKLRTDSQTGTDIHEIYYRCRCVSPRSIPDGFGEQTMAECVITDPRTGRESHGQFFVRSAVQNRLAQPSAILGDEFSGYFVEGGGDV